VLLPLGGLLIVLFVGWYLSRADVHDEISNGGLLKARFLGAFLFIVKFIAPVAIAIVFLNSIGIIK
jgi:neurotransmitter:Na+ symporter, NSS family